MGSTAYICLTVGRFMLMNCVMHLTTSNGSKAKSTGSLTMAT